MKYFVKISNRADLEPIKVLLKKMKKCNILTNQCENADAIISVGDRKEVFDFTLNKFRENVPIIHLWAGEISQGTHDEVYRHSITLMSEMQLCAHENAKSRVESLCSAINKIPNAYVIGNLFIDDLTIDESLVPPIYPYDLILYNPPTTLSEEEINKEVDEIVNLTLDHDRRECIWIEPNGDKKNKYLSVYVNQITVPREQFLGLLKNCKRFISNSSSIYYEAPLFLSKDKIIQIGKRNKNRECGISNLNIKNASDKIIEILKNYDKYKR